MNKCGPLRYAQNANVFVQSKAGRVNITIKLFYIKFVYLILQRNLEIAWDIFGKTNPYPSPFPGQRNIVENSNL